MNELIGTWELVEWDCLIDEAYHSHPFGEDAQGMLQYTAEGQMAAILMRRERPMFNVSSLAKGTDAEKMAAVNGYISYAGSYRAEGNKVIHSVKYSLFPNWIDTDLVRFIDWKDEGGRPQLVLTTQPQIVSSGKQVVNRLHWMKVNRLAE